MFTVCVATPVPARHAPAPASAPERRGEVGVRAAAKSVNADSSAKVSALSRRRAVFGAAAAVSLVITPSPALAKRTNRLTDLSSLSPSEQEYASVTLRLIAQTSALVDGDGTGTVDSWLASASEWQGFAPQTYSPKSQGKSFLMTTKLVSYLKNSFSTIPTGTKYDAANPPFDKTKTAEWVSYAEGFTTGTLAGDDARAAFAKATWGNYDKSAPLNRFGLCAFGETGGTKALGVDCDGY